MAFWRGVFWRAIIIIVIIISTELLALCDRCLGWGWVWRGGLVAGLWVGQAFGVLLLPEFGFSSSSPQVPGHPTSTCDAGVSYILNMLLSSGPVVITDLLSSK